MKVNNRKCISRLSTRLLLANKRRNLITIFAIILTAVLFTSLFTIMLSITASYETSVFRQIGGSSHGTFKDVTPAQEERLISHKLIKEYGERMVLGVIAEEPFKNQSAEISFMDENVTKWSFIELEEGHLPTAKDEVVMDREALRLLGYEPVLGEKIELSFQPVDDPEQDRRYTGTFTLVGYWEFDSLCPAHFINVSKAYAEDFAATVEGMGMNPIRTDLDVMFSSAAGAGAKMEKVIADCGYTIGGESTDDMIRIGVNPGYTASSLDGDDWPGLVIPLGAFVLLVIFTGYLIIYNVFQISVANDIRFYGLLKTIGTTQKQIRRVIRLQASALCVVGIPLGLFLGYLLGSVLTPAVMNTTTISRNSVTVSTSPVIFVASLLFEVITVLLSVNKPGKMAGKVSPIEALRFNDGMTGGKKERATRGAKAWQMAFANTERNKKKTVLVFTSLALSLVILNAINMFVGGFDAEKWVDSSMSVDFIVGKYPYFKFQRGEIESISEEEIALVKENVQSSGGGTAYAVNSLTLMDVGPESYKDCFLEGMDDYLLDKLDVCEGDISLLKDKTARNIALITHRDESGSYILDENAPRVGDRIMLATVEDIVAVDTRTGEPAGDDAYNYPEYLDIRYEGWAEYEYTVCAYVAVPNDISLRCATLNLDGILCSDVLKADFADWTVPVFYAFDTESAEAEEQTELFMKRFTEEISGMAYESKAVHRAEFEDFKKMFVLLGGVLCGIIGFVGALNFINAIMAGILARKNEIAVLQAIGMTGKQVKEMLITEGMIYTVGSGLLALLLSLIFIPVINSAGNNIFGFYSNHFSVTPVVLMIPILALLGVLVPLLSYNGLARASIVERIREIG